MGSMLALRRNVRPRAPLSQRSALSRVAVLALRNSLACSPSLGYSQKAAVFWGETAMSRVVAAVLAALGILYLGQPSNALTIGISGGSGTSVPFNYNFSQSSVGQSIDWFQIYDASAFSGPINFDTITFFSTINSPTQVVTGNYIITFGTTSAALGSGSVPSQSNVSTFFSGSLSAANVTGGFSISGATYSYDPSAGNLLMEILVTDQSVGSIHGYFDADDANAGVGGYSVATTSIWVAKDPGNGGAQIAIAAAGMVTKFDSPSAVPLPSALPLLASGLGGLGLLGWRRSRDRIGRALAS